MNDSVLTSVLLPVALAIIMFGLGLTLTVADFSRVLRMPKAVLIALGTQVILLPVICFGLVTLFELEPAHASRHDAAGRLSGRHHGEPVQSPGRMATSPSTSR